MGFLGAMLAVSIQPGQHSAITTSTDIVGLSVWGWVLIVALAGSFVLGLVTGKRKTRQARRQST